MLVSVIFMIKMVFKVKVTTLFSKERQQKNTHLVMLWTYINTFLRPELRRQRINMRTVYFQQDGATAHITAASMVTARNSWFHGLVMYPDHQGDQTF